MKELMSYAATFKREKVSAKHLIVGMKCGGSDGLSGITANPTVGLFSDMLVSKGGTTILTEVPEMFGAETILMNRCANKELFEKTVHLINDFKDTSSRMVRKSMRIHHQETRMVVSQHLKISHLDVHRSLVHHLLRVY